MFYEFLSGDRPDLVSEIYTRVPEHQQLLTFTNDGDAECWADWWASEGLAAFMSYVDKMRTL